MNSHNIVLTEQEYKDFHSGTPTPRNAEILIDRYKLNISSKRLAEEKETLTHSFLSKNTFPLMPNALSTIQYFHAMRLKLGVVTGAGKFGVSSTLKGHQLGKYFEVVTTGDDVAKSKPDPSVYLLAMKKMGFKTDECIAIEDTENGIRSAIAAGLICCAVKNDYSAGHNLSLASKVFDDMKEAQ